MQTLNALYLGIANCPVPQNFYKSIKASKFVLLIVCTNRNMQLKIPR